MIKAVKQKRIVSKQGKIEIESSELHEGVEVEIIILIPSPEINTTEYLLSTEANHQKLSHAVETVELQENLVSINSPEWSDTWSDEDISDISTFAWQYAKDNYSDNEELI